MVKKAYFIMLFYLKIENILITDAVEKQNVRIFTWFFPGIHIAYCNLSQILGVNGTVAETNYMYEDLDIIRSVSVAQKYKVMTLVLYKDKNATTLSFSLNLKNSNNSESQVCYVCFSKLPLVVAVLVVVVVPVWKTTCH